MTHNPYRSPAVPTTSGVLPSGADAYKSGLEAGKKSFMDRWLAKDAPVTTDARFAALGIEKVRLEMDLRTVPNGVTLRLGDPPHVKASRTGLIDAMSYGVYCGHEDKAPPAIAFVTERVLPIIRDGEWFEFGDVDLSGLKGIATDWRPFAEAGLVQLPFPKTTFHARLDVSHLRAEGAETMNIVWIAEQPEPGGPISIMSLFINNDTLREWRLSVAGFHCHDKASLQAHARTRTL